MANSGRAEQVCSVESAIFISVCVYAALHTACRVLVLFSCTRIGLCAAQEKHTQLGFSYGGECGGRWL